MQDEVGIEGPEEAPGGEDRLGKRVSRRGLIAKGAAFAAGGVGLTALVATPAEAFAGTMMYGAQNDAGDLETALQTQNPSFAFVVINNGTGQGVRGLSFSGIGVSGSGAVGVLGEGDQSIPGSVPLRLTPALMDGPPTLGGHSRGDVYTDVYGRIFTCITGGLPGVWTRPGLNPITPYRVCDTRPGTGTPYSTGTKVGPGVNLLVAVAGQPIADYPVPAGATAIIANLTVTEGTAPSYLTVYPGGAIPRPTASNINFVGGQTIANQVTVGVAADGNIKIYNNAGSVHVILDLAGFFF